MRPVVSVVMPLYNKAAYFREAIESVLSQTFSQYEILVIDDASTDGSGTLADQVQSEFPNKVRVLRHPGHVNRGVNASRNLAVSECRGDVIAYLDADDLWTPNKLDHDIRILDAQPEAAAVVSHTRYWWQDGRKRDRKDRLGPELDTLIPPPQLFLRCYVENMIPSPCVCSVALRASVAKELQWDPTYPVAGDMKYFAELLYRFPVFLSSDCLATYRRLDDGIWSSSMGNGAEADTHKRFRAWMEELTAQPETHR